MTRRKVILLACAFAVAATTAALIVRWRSSCPQFVWDFTRGRTAASLGVPKRTHPFDPFYHITVHGRVVSDFGAGHVFDEEVLLVTFHQNKPGVVDGISLDLEPQTVDDALNTAMKFAREWNLKTAPLIEWRDNARAGKLEYAQTIRNDLKPTIAVEIFKT